MKFLNGLPALKHRHLLTRAGNIRLRYVAVTGFAILAGLWSGMTSYSSDGNASIAPQRVAEQRLIEGARLTTAVALREYDPEQPGRGLSPYYSFLGDKPVFDRPYSWSRTITVEPGDSLGKLMEQTPLSGEDYIAGMKGLKEHIDPRDIRPGQTIEVGYITENNQDRWDHIDYRIDGLNTVTIRRDAHGAIIVDKQEKAVTTKTHAARAVVSNSLFYDLSRAGVPDGVINNLIQAYSWSVDFQRDIWGGETVELLYETRETEDGSYLRSGRLLYANLGLRGKSLPIYLFEKEEGYESFFEPDGQSIRKALLRTPVNGARLSSGYGKRKHPVLGYTKMHKGLDFAAPIGTPVFAAGDGVVQRANRFGSYGNYMKIKHNDTYSTAYAHLHKFAKGIRPGVRVRQGQVVAYVGNTGRSTGPHLHYEVMVKGKQVNPHSMDLPIGEKLKGQQLASFKQVVSQTRQQFASAIRDSATYAAFDGLDAQNQ